MVAGKVKAAMGFQKSPGTPKLDFPRRSSSTPSSTKAAATAAAATPNSSTSSSSSSASKSTTVFSRSFGVYFPGRSSAQVQPKPPDVADLLRVIEDLHEKESRLRIQLLEHKLLKETVSIVPFLEKELASSKERIELLEAEKVALVEETKRKEERMKEMAAEIEDLKQRTTVVVVGDTRRIVGSGDIEECISSSCSSSSQSQRFQGLIDASARSNLLKNLRKGPKTTDIVVVPPKEQQVGIAKPEEEKKSTMMTTEVAKAPRIPKPPPLPKSITSRKSTSSSSSSSSSSSTDTAAMAPPPPPPPPPPPMSRGIKMAAASVRRVPEVVEFYHSLMRRGDSKRESGSGVTEATSAANARNMIGEIENRSAHLLAIKSDVETQGDFIRSLISEVENAAFTNIEDLVSFVKWLDDELSYLVDERAVLKHFDWPEQKSDAMREAAFGYCDLKKLHSEASSFRDDRGQPCSSALKKMQALLEKLEHAVYNVSRVREGAAKRYKGFQIPWEWMMDTGFVIQIKLASVKLAMKCMKRVSSELETVAGGPEEEELVLQGVRFAFRVHQFAGGFDVETMRAFQELRDKALSLQCQRQSQEQQNLLSRSMSMSC